MIETKNIDIDVKKIMEHIENEAEKYNLGTVKTVDFEIPSKYDFKIKDTYTIDDFLQYYDTAFLENAYWAIMGRAPDETGIVSNLQMLRSGKATRTDILMALRFSEEGKTKNVKIFGLEKLRMIGRLRKIPLLGSVISFVYTQLTLNKRLNQMEAQLGKLYYQDSILRDVVNEKCDRSAAEYLRLRLKDKVDKTELAHHKSKKDNRG